MSVFASLTRGDAASCLGEMVMRRFTLLGLLVGLSLSTTGCIMVLGGALVSDVSDHKKIVEIDDDLYLLDLKTNRIRKIDKQSLVHTETTITTVTPDDD